MKGKVRLQFAANFAVDRKPEDDFKYVFPVSRYK